MRGSLILLAVLVGAANWAFRVLPMKVPIPGAGGTGPVARFLSATGPAAIATLFVASVLPDVQAGGITPPLMAGVAAVCAVYVWRRSVGLATVMGAFAYGLAVWTI